MRSSDRLPPLQSLRVFQAVARRLSFKKAGEDLLITQSAVSHHIRQLEEFTGARLFVRKARTIDLTPDGTNFYSATAEAFDLIAKATADLRAQSGKATLRISLLPSFMAGWLLSRISDFQEKYPDIDLDFDPSLRLSDLDAGEADLAIRYGGTKKSDQSGTVLYQERLTPVASPELFGDGRRFRSPADLLEHHLLFSNQSFEWTTWSDAAGIDLKPANVTRLTDYNIVVQAALDGRGVAMGRSLLVEEHLRAGRLIKPFDLEATSERSVYRLHISPRTAHRQNARLFERWLSKELADPHKRCAHIDC